MKISGRMGVDQSGTAYIGNIEYNTLRGNSSLTAISRIYNAEGYVESPANPQYHYYRRDHLGNNREVWLANTNTTKQRTQYYPSGLPWPSNSDDDPGLQNKKYNGKEFVEMHGYDTYDIVWRQYYPAIARFQTPDPEIEDAYNESPYAMCDNNMVNRTDPDGRFWNYVAGGFAGATVEYLGQVTANIAQNGGRINKNVFTNVDLVDIGIATVEGIVTSGGSAIKSAGVKFGVAVGAELVSNTFDYSTKDGGNINNAPTALLNTVIGLSTGAMTTKAKINVLPTQSKTKAINNSRSTAHSKGKGLKTSDAKQIGKKQNEKNTRAKNVNKTLSNNVNQAMGSAGGETIKVEENEKRKK